MKESVSICCILMLQQKTERVELWVLCSPNSMDLFHNTRKFQLDRRNSNFLESESKNKSTHYWKAFIASFFFFSFIESYLCPQLAHSRSCIGGQYILIKLKKWIISSTELHIALLSPENQIYICKFNIIFIFVFVKTLIFAEDYFLL